MSLKEQVANTEPAGTSAFRPSGRRLYVVRTFRTLGLAIREYLTHRVEGVQAAIAC
jgi:hypothetical protein